MTESSPGENPMQVFATLNEIGIINQLATTLLAASLPDGIHPSHFSIINHLSRMGDGKTPIRIANAMQVTKNTMTHSLRVLEGRGFIEVRPNPEDGRGKLVYLTAAGRTFRDTAISRLIDRVGPIMTDEIHDILARIAPDLARIRAHLDDNRP